MTAGCGSLAVAEVNNMYQLWGLLILGGIGIGGNTLSSLVEYLHITHFFVF